MSEPGDTPDPTFSVVVPTCNRPELLARCLDALAPGHQTVAATAYEVIVTDDSSDDASHNLIMDRYPWARWARGPRRGPAANRNSGAASARGTALLFIDDDCVPDAEWIGGFVAALDAGWQLSPGRTVSRDPWPSPLYFAPRNDTGDVVWSCNMFVRRDAFLAVGGFDERYPSAHMEDADFHARARKRGLTSGFSPHAVVDHPPRRLAGGRTLGEHHYAELLYGLLHGTPTGLVLTLRRVAAARLAALRAYPLSRDSVIAFGSLLVELAWVVWRWPAWRAGAARAVGT